MKPNQSNAKEPQQQKLQQQTPKTHHHNIKTSKKYQTITMAKWHYHTAGTTHVTTALVL